MTHRLNVEHRDVHYVLQIQLRLRPRRASPTGSPAPSPGTRPPRPSPTSRPSRSPRRSTTPSPSSPGSTSGTTPRSLPVPLGSSDRRPPLAQRRAARGQVGAPHAHCSPTGCGACRAPIPDSRLAPDWIAAPPMPVPPGRVRRHFVVSSSTPCHPPSGGSTRSARTAPRTARRARRPARRRARANSTGRVLELRGVPGLERLGEPRRDDASASAGRRPRGERLVDDEHLGLADDPHPAHSRSSSGPGVREPLADLGGMMTAARSSFVAFSSLAPRSPCRRSRSCRAGPPSPTVPSIIGPVWIPTPIRSGAGAAAPR